MNLLSEWAGSCCTDLLLSELLRFHIFVGKWSKQMNLIWATRWGIESQPQLVEIHWGVILPFYEFHFGVIENIILYQPPYIALWFITLILHRSESLKGFFSHIFSEIIWIFWMISVEAMAVFYTNLYQVWWSSMKWYEIRSPPTKILWIEKDAMLQDPQDGNKAEGLWRPRGGIGAIGRGGGDTADTLHLGWIGDGLATFVGCRFWLLPRKLT